MPARRSVLAWVSGPATLAAGPTDQSLYLYQEARAKAIPELSPPRSAGFRGLPTLAPPERWAGSPPSRFCPPARLGSKGLRHLLNHSEHLVNYAYTHEHECAETSETTLAGGASGRGWGPARSRAFSRWYEFASCRPAVLANCQKYGAATRGWHFVRVVLDYIIGYVSLIRGIQIIMSGLKRSNGGMCAATDGGERLSSRYLIWD